MQDSKTSTCDDTNNTSKSHAISEDCCQKPTSSPSSQLSPPSITTTSAPITTASIVPPNDSNDSVDCSGSKIWEDKVTIVRKFYETRGYRVHSGLQFGCELVLYVDSPQVSLFYMHTCVSFFLVMLFICICLFVIVSWFVCFGAKHETA